jgi:hypothetical protein
MKENVQARKDLRRREVCGILKKGGENNVGSNRSYIGDIGTACIVLGLV